MSGGYGFPTAISWVRVRMSIRLPSTATAPESVSHTRRERGLWMLENVDR